MSKLDKQGTTRSDKKSEVKERKLNAAEKKALAELENQKLGKMARRE